MINYKKKYLNFFGYGEQDFVPCELCGQEAVEPHHIIFKSQIGKDNIENLIGLCRKHHNMAHRSEISAEYLTERHLQFMKLNKYGNHR